jgi:hypothetical protein
MVNTVSVDVSDFSSDAQDSVSAIVSVDFDDIAVVDDQFSCVVDVGLVDSSNSDSIVVTSVPIFCLDVASSDDLFGVSAVVVLVEPRG